MPWLSGSTTLSANRVAKAASAALPPCRSISAPASAARGSAALTMPLADTDERACATGCLANAAGPAMTSRPAMKASECRRMGVELLGPDRVGNVGEALTVEPLRQPARDPSGDAGPLVNHRAVELDQARPGSDPLPGIVCGGDPADPDQRDLSARRRVEIAQRLERQRLERRAGQSSMLAGVARFERRTRH